MVDRFKWEKWVGWARRIEEDLAIVVDHRGDFDGFGSVVDQNLDWILGNQGAWFLDFVRHSYAAYACMGVRRQLKLPTGRRFLGA